MSAISRRIERAETALSAFHAESDEVWAARYLSLYQQFLTVLSDSEWHTWEDVSERCVWEDRTAGGTEFWVQSSVLEDFRETGSVDERYFPDTNRSFEIRLVEPGTGRAWSEVPSYKLSKYMILRAIRILREGIPPAAWDDYSRKSIKEAKRILAHRRATWPVKEGYSDFQGYDKVLIGVSWDDI
jgi:hypothetical protein